MQYRQWFVAAFLTLFLVVFNGAAHAQDFNAGNDDPFAQNQFLPVDQAFQFDFRQQGKELELTFEIAEGYYLYQHRFQFDPAIPLAAQPQLPEGEAHYDEFFGESIIYRDQVTLKLTLANIAASNFTLGYQGCADAGLCYPPSTKEIPLGAVTDSAATGVEPVPAAVDFEQIAANSQQFTANSLFSDLTEQPLVWVLLVFFVAGIGLAFTPCVLPMYPILSTVIMGPNKALKTTRAFTLSFAYVQGMAITYSALGIVVALAGLRYQAMLQHPVVLIVLAALFVLLALSMLGLYNLQLPSKWQNYLNEVSQQQRGGAHRSVFVMGVLSGLIASPCTTAPLSGVLLFIAQSGDIAVGASVLYALSLGMGLPLILFGTTGGKLLPKAGAWMNVVKRIFGVVLLAVAVIFIERLLPVAVADWLWIAFISLSALYLIITSLRDIESGVAVVISAAWLALATWLLFLWWPQGNHGELPFKQVSSVTEIEAQLASAEPTQLVMLDLYADWCVACKEFERYTFTDAQVQTALADAIVLQADVTKNTPTTNALLQNYQVVGLPTILFFYDGKLVPNARVAGFLDAEAFVKHLEEVEATQNLQ
ncbi:protein-disulfide reductase DsbD [Pseudidiomarina homiensis]|uniref:Thiol:disulfide interchange protein DsbD n=1 Tax=Pseudidiomarina homiensis TaxID=364198 RepID=A0A432XYH0_9GAMM|nr:protein-disulfide reductase DsbD [Pseudidiomarina homiensis]RUO53683.1 protein-disulfide reductase DsbD [Pseudidiomarina homiensis]